MSCPKNPQKFLFFKYEGSCIYKDTYVCKMMTKEYFEVTQECSNCKSTRQLDFVSSQVMIRSGYNIEKLKKMSWRGLGSTPEELR